MVGGQGVRSHCTPKSTLDAAKESGKQRNKGL